MEGIAFCFYDVAVPIFGQQAAPGRAFAAGGGIPGSLTGDDIFGGNNVGN
jgi:hypothetical protein